MNSASDDQDGSARMLGCLMLVLLAMLAAGGIYGAAVFFHTF